MTNVSTDRTYNPETGAIQVVHLVSDLPPEISNSDADADALRVAFLGTGHDVQVAFEGSLLTVVGFIENPPNVVKVAVNHVADQRSYQHC